MMSISEIWAPQKKCSGPVTKETEDCPSNNEEENEEGNRENNQDGRGRLVYLAKQRDHRIGTWNAKLWNYETKKALPKTEEPLILTELNVVRAICLRRSHPAVG